jgi:tagatose-6-phosphate ketose/aldose isomerase
MSASPGEGPVSAVHPDHRSLAQLLANPLAEQRQRGYVHTAQEIDQQPETWLETARSAVSHRRALRERLALADVLPGGGGVIVLTGSGSSHYVAECAAISLQRSLGVPVRAASSGEILTHLDGCLPTRRPGLLVSLARSGDSPESAGAVEEVLAARPACHHLIITCNGAGRLATTYDRHPRVLRIVLDERTCDRSLVMTSSFTNMVIAASALAALNAPEAFVATVERIAEVGRSVLQRSHVLSAAAHKGFRSTVFLGSGSRFGAARECALKMLEMTAGRVPAMPETFLGLRHGPMSAVHADTLVVCLLASDPVTRAYELDLVREINRKSLGVRLIVGDHVPSEVVRPGDIAFECPGLGGVGDDLAAVTDVMVGQLLALFRCLALGLQPDAPSEHNVISRVVEDFALHYRYASNSVPER